MVKKKKIKNVEFVKMSSKGQVTIPVKIRKSMNLKSGDRVFIFESKHQLIIKPFDKELINNLVK